MPRSRLLRALIVLVVLGSFAGAGQALFCAEVERCVMAGAPADGVAPPCTPEMGGDCCEEGEPPTGPPTREETAQARTPALVAAIADPVAVVPSFIPAVRPADASSPARLQAAVPLYTLLATLLI